MSKPFAQPQTSLFALEDELAGVCRQLYQHFAPRKPLPKDIQVSFYPFVGLNNTIRLRQGILYVRFSDLLKEAPSDVLSAVAGILVAKLLKKPVPSAFQDQFKSFAQSQTTKRAIDTTRRTRGFKYVTSTQGQVYDLTELFHRLNQKYFDGKLDHPTLTWSRTRTRRILGHYDRAHHTLVISRTLDSHQIPDQLIAYVMYHEMLHIKHKARHLNGRAYVHTPEFYADEKKFEHYDTAMRWLEKLASSRKSKKQKGKK